MMEKFPMPSPEQQSTEKEQQSTEKEQQGTEKEQQMLIEREKFEKEIEQLANEAYDQLFGNDQDSWNTDEIESTFIIGRSATGKSLRTERKKLSSKDYMESQGYLDGFDENMDKNEFLEKVKLGIAKLTDLSNCPPDTLSEGASRLRREEESPNEIIPNDPVQNTIDKTRERAKQILQTNPELFAILGEKSKLLQNIIRVEHTEESILIKELSNTLFSAKVDTHHSNIKSTSFHPIWKNADQRKKVHLGYYSLLLERDKGVSGNVLPDKNWRKTIENWKHMEW